MSVALGSIPASPELLKRASTGFWAFELDEGKEPRMYVDEAMLPLLGLTEQISPEEMYHAWYDHVDTDCYDLVADAVNKMIDGKLAEVTYPWHYACGRTIIVRCGGVRNYAYTQGIRVEGYHQDITATEYFTYEQARQKQRLERDYQTIQGLSNEYDILHLLNLETDEFTPFYVEKEYILDTDFLIGSHEGFYAAMRASIKAMVHPDYLEKMLKYTDKNYLKEVLRTKSRHVERILVKIDGVNYTWSDFVLIKFDDVFDEAKEIALGYINVDEEMKALLSERERMDQIEKKVEEERRAKEAETERYNFLINVAHEIRTPLTLIMGPLGRLQTTEQLSEKGSITVNRVRQQANKMNILLNTVLTSSKMDDGAEEVSPAPVKFNEWVRKNADDFVDEAEIREMPISFEFDPAIDVANIDEHLCNIVLSNFIVNALRYNEAGSHILISTKLTGNGRKVRVSIKDRGAGIGNVNADQMFERYFRATEDKTGFGIGLFYSKNIVDAHHGEVGAYNNTDGCGATFWFELPIE